MDKRLAQRRTSVALAALMGPAIETTMAQNSIGLKTLNLMRTTGVATRILFCSLMAVCAAAVYWRWRTDLKTKRSPVCTRKLTLIAVVTESFLVLLAWQLIHTREKMLAQLVMAFRVHHSVSIDKPLLAFRKILSPGPLKARWLLEVQHVPYSYYKLANARDALLV